MKIELEHFLEEWVTRSGLAEAASGADGGYYLLFDREYEVRLSQRLRIIQLETDLGELPNERSTAGTILDELMALQLAGSRETAEVLAVDDETGHLILFRALQAERLDSTLFAGALSQFVNGQEFWARQLKALRAPSSSPIAPMSIVHA